MNRLSQLAAALGEVKDLLEQAAELSKHPGVAELRKGPTMTKKQARGAVKPGAKVLVPAAGKNIGVGGSNNIAVVKASAPKKAKGKKGR